MREKRSNDKRTVSSNARTPKKKYLLFYEGEKTEDIYFEAVQKEKEDLGISPLIEMIPLMRGYSERTSNPQKMIETIIHTLDSQDADIVTYEMLLNEMVEICDTSIPNYSKRIIFKMLKEICQNDLKVKLDAPVTSVSEGSKAIITHLKEKVTFKKEFEYITEVSRIHYDKDYGDRICLIVDRDSGSFKEDQYDWVLATCKERDYDFYLTNPCFEFWLLMHFDLNDLNKLDLEKIKNNDCINSNKELHYVEDVLNKAFLKEKIGKFKKSKYHTKFLIDHLDRAIKNEEHYCKDLTLLKEQVGSNVGLLIENMRGKQV